MIRMGMSGLQRITVSVVFIRRQAYGTGLLRLFPCQMYTALCEVKARRDMCRELCTRFVLHPKAK